MIIRNANAELHQEVVASREDRRKEYDDAMKANEKEAKEIQKGHGEKGKKITNKALKAMHLSEALFEDALPLTERRSRYFEPAYSHRYKVRGYFDNSYRGLDVSEDADDWSTVQDIAHELLSKGDSVRVNDYETGRILEITSEEYDGEGIEEFMMESVEKPKRYSDGKTGKWWYFTTHGVQPGSVPKDLNVLEVKDTPNGTYFALDGILNTSELKEYDIKEKTPPVDEALTLDEGKWDFTLNNGKELRQAIYDENYVEVINQIRIAYKQMLDEGLIDEDDFESWTEDFELYGDFSDWDDPEDTVNYELTNFYDACDNLGVWVPINEDISDYEFDERDQEITSKSTAHGNGRANGGRGRVPALFTKIKFPRGSVVFDYGCGEYSTSERIMEYLGEDITYLGFDKFNRTSEENREAVATLRRLGGADIVTCANVLNVIKERDIRVNQVIKNIYNVLKPGGVAYFDVYADKKKEGPKQTGKDKWQEFRGIETYIEEVEEIFGNGKVTRKGTILIAKK